MTRHYGPSERRRMGDLSHGMRVSTLTLANATYLASAQQDVFTVYGRILVTELYVEAITQFGGQATTILFNYRGTTPVIAVANMCAAVVVNALPQGNRITFLGGAVATLASITDGAGLTDLTCATPHIIGTATIAGVQGVGLIGVLTAVAAQLSGTCQITIVYAPMEDGARVITTL